MARPPYPAHLCAQDPEAFAGGFDGAARWIEDHGPVAAEQVWHAIRDSTWRPWPETAARIGFPADAEGEGRALGIYGLVALERR